MSISPSKSFLRLVMDEENPAPCTGEDPELFFPNFRKGEEPTWENRLQVKDAKAVCQVCPIDTKVACLEYALETDDGYGIYGQTTPAERDEIKHKREVRAQRDALREARRAA